MLGDISAPARGLFRCHSVSCFGLAPIWLGREEVRLNKQAKGAFDAQDFLAKVGVGKTFLRLEKNENEAVVGVLGAGQFFGEGCMNGHPLRIATTTAMESSLITAITKQAMKATLHDQRAFSELFVAYLLTRNSRIEEDLIDQLFNSSERRLARMLLLLSHFGKEGSSQTITPNISQETLAEMIGTTRSRVSHFMNKFRKLGLISYNGHIEVNSSLLDAVLHDKPELREDE